MYQSGYLTIEKKEEQALTLDYPNKEVLNSISQHYLSLYYHVGQYSAIGNDLWRALSSGDLRRAKELYNTALAGIPYQLLANGNEAQYHALFLMLLRGAGISGGEVSSAMGRCDAVITFPGRVIVLEFKLARSAKQAAAKSKEGELQIAERGYSDSFGADTRPVQRDVIVIDAQKRRAL